MTKTATPWGTATLVERLTLKQQAGDKRFSSVVELLENDRGERLVRCASVTSSASARRSQRRPSSRTRSARQ